MKYEIVATKRYRKDYKRLTKSGIHLADLDRVIDQLAAGLKLADKYSDHKLQGNLEGTRECHIGPDWLLHYRKDNGALILILLSTGDHRHVFGIE